MWILLFILLILFIIYDSEYRIFDKERFADVYSIYLHRDIMRKDLRWNLYHSRGGSSINYRLPNTQSLI